MFQFTSLSLILHYIPHIIPQFFQLLLFSSDFTPSLSYRLFTTLYNYALYLHLMLLYFLLSFIYIWSHVYTHLLFLPLCVHHLSLSFYTLYLSIYITYRYHSIYFYYLHLHYSSYYCKLVILHHIPNIILCTISILSTTFSYHSIMHITYRYHSTHYRAYQ